MSSPNKSKERGICLHDMPIMSLKKGVKRRRFDAGKKLRDPKFVAKAFFEALTDCDIDAALDALQGYLLSTKKSTISKASGVPSSTVYHALTHGSNPTLKTVARLLQAQHI